MFSYEFNEILKKTYFEKHHQATASVCGVYKQNVSKSIYHLESRKSLKIEIEIFHCYLHRQLFLPEI